MGKEKAYRALRETARRNGINLETVMREIENVIATGMSNPDLNVQAFWRNVPRRGDIPTPIELIVHISGMEKQKRSTAATRQGVSP